MGRNDEPTPDSEDTDAGGVSPRLVIGVLLGIALATFVGQNTETTTVTFLVFDAEQPLWLILLATAAVSIVVAELVTGARRRRRRRE